MKHFWAAALLLAACAEARSPAPSDTEPGPVSGDGGAAADVAAKIEAPAPPAAVPIMPETEKERIELGGVLAQGGFARGRAFGEQLQDLRLDGAAVPFLPDGRFFIAFGRDAALQAELTARYAGGDTVTRYLTLGDSDFPVSRLPARTTRDVEEAPGFRERRRAELARIGSARAEPSALTGWTESFTPPVDAPVSSRFGAQRYYGDVPRSPHSGTDFAAATGTPVLAPASGRVVLAGPDFSYEGNLVIVDHGLGLYSAFLHLSEIDVRQGDMLARGARLGAVGASGRATGPHLHWGLWWNGVRFDPQRLLDAPSP